MRELESLVQPVVEAAGLELVDVAFHGGRGGILRVTVDRDGGVDLDTIAEVSERLSRRLDLEDFNPGPYTLEVSSPGVERPLRRPDDFARRVGSRVRVRIERPDEAPRSVEGTIVEAGGDSVTVAADSGVETLRYQDIAAARTVFEWPAGGGNEKRRKKGER
ncbi:MAG TPA: ribosome maturation factor RimP [Actinomycetota bacterium]|nr:ribosome maturation factor RimP [Actinomycetota bacterium]